MSKEDFASERSLASQLLQMDRQELCAFTAGLCRRITEEVGTREYRGGIFPENIRLDEDGRPAIGPGRRSEWEGQELQFVAPELYWNGRCGPASDVYSLGLLLYYGVTGGRLPFEGEAQNAQLTRMSGKEIAAPEAAGRRLGEIIAKALRFRESERYGSPAALQEMLESMEEDKYLGGESAARAVFKKDEGELTELERMMLAIMGADAAAAVPAAPSAAQEAPIAEEAPITEELLSGLLEKGETPVTSSGADAETLAAFTEPEDVRVYEPAHEKKEHEAAEEKDTGRQPIPILTEEKNPELAPVVLSQSPARPNAVQYSRNPERSREIAEEVKKRRKRPWLVVLLLCALLIVAAVIGNALLKDYAWKDEVGVKTVTTPEPGESAPQTEASEAEIIGVVESEESSESTAMQSVYQVFVSDASWTEAREICESLGGYLAVISDQEEFRAVAALAEQAGVSNVWIGCHREGESLIWEHGADVDYYPWAPGEPSYTDGDTAEDYVMLWHSADGWMYNDNRNDPAAAYPGNYSGSMGFVCEFGG